MAIVLWSILAVLALLTLSLIWFIKRISALQLTPLNRSSQGKVILVTGAASGIGRHATETLISKGCFVFACDINHDLLHSVFDNVANVKPITMDVSKIEDVQNTLRIVNEEGRGLDGLVNSAGIVDLEGHTHGIVEISEEQSQKVMNINFFGVTRCCRAFFPLLVQSKGSIVNIASVAGRITLPFSGYYSCSKFAMVAYSNALRGECKALDLPIRVCCIEPGFVKTPLLSFGPLLKWDRQSRWHDFLSARHVAKEQKMFSIAMESPEQVTQAILCGLFSDPPPPHILVDSPLRIFTYRLASSILPDSAIDDMARKA